MEKTENYIMSALTDTQLDNQQEMVAPPSDTSVRKSNEDKLRDILENCDAHEAVDLLRVLLVETHNKLRQYMNWGCRTAITGTIDSGSLSVSLFDPDDFSSSGLTGSWVNGVQL